MSQPRIDIVGAGPSGLAAALAARARGAGVTVYEKRPDVGARFGGDFQGLENWTGDRDVLAELEQLGIAATFDATPVDEIVCFGPDLRARTLRAAAPIFYLVRRGREPGTLDQALKTQALAAGVDIRFGERLQHLARGGVVAEGPHRADVIATGFVFDTDMADGCYAAVSDRLAPKGYSYLLIDKGRGTVATCLFDRFHEERRYLEGTVDFFERAVGLRWQSAKRFGGSGNFQRVVRTVVGERAYVGESAGFQDALFGFGLRYALVSGHLAGQGRDYKDSWRGQLGRLNAASIANRWLYGRLGDRGYQAVLRWVVDGRDPRQLLKRIYRPTRWKLALANWVSQPPRRGPDAAPDHCDCTWCRCQREWREAVS